MLRIAKFALVTVSTIAVSCAPVVLGQYQTGSGGRVMWRNNCDFYGQDYRSIRAVPAVCGDVCATDAVCTHWAWNYYNGGTCWFKTGIPSTATVQWGTNCGYVISRSSQQSQTAPASGLSLSDMSYMLGRINAYRSQYGLAALTIDNRLVTSSLLHSQDQAKNCVMTHTGSNGSNLGMRIQAQGYRFAVAEENLAAGQKSVDEVMTAWWNSPPHRANILRKDVTNVGFGKADNNGCSTYATYWTQDYGVLL